MTKLNTEAKLLSSVSILGAIFVEYGHLTSLLNEYNKFKPKEKFYPTVLALGLFRSVASS